MNIQKKMILTNLCPKALSHKPFTVMDAIYDLRNDEAPLIPEWLHHAMVEIPHHCWDSHTMMRLFKKYNGRTSGAISTKLLFWDKESCTLLKNEIGTSAVIHPDKKRKLSISEYKRLGSFHDSFKFISRNSAVMRIGNSVPPLLMRAIAINLRHYLFDGNPLLPFPKAMSYLDILNTTWEEHLKIKSDNAPSVISTFAGCGGSSLGYSMAGYNERLAIEMDNDAIKTFRNNFNDIPIFNGDIATISVEECIELAELTGVGDLDLLDGSPPCQGFSTAGKRQMKDNRNQLFREYIRLLRGLQPKVFIMENVSGMVKGKMKLIFAEIMTVLKESGYEVKAWLINAKYFYVPQSRERLFFIGVRKDCIDIS